MAELQGVPVYRVRRSTGPLVVDGRLDEAAWQMAEAVELVDTITGEPPRQKTTVRLLYDNMRLYVGFHALDRDIWGTLTGHDDPIYDEEVVEIFLDSCGLLTTYLEFEVSPLNTGFDALIVNDAVVSGTQGRGERFQGFTAYDPQGFRHAVHIQGKVNAGEGGAEFWECEMAIAFADLYLGGRVPPAAGDRWRFNLYRIDGRAPALEETAFSPTGVSDFHAPSRFGWLEFC